MFESNRLQLLPGGNELLRRAVRARAAVREGSAYTWKALRMTTDTLPAKQMTARNPVSEERFPFMHSREKLKAGDVAEVMCSHQCAIMLMDDENLAHFVDGHKFHYYGGFYKKLPAQIPAPTTGDWNVVVHMNGSKARFAYSVAFRKR